MTRFVVLARDPVTPDSASGPVMTSFLFEVKNVPAALYKAMGGFATNGVNMTKLESYQRGASFAATEFYADIDGMPGDPGSRPRARGTGLPLEMGAPARQLQAGAAAVGLTCLIAGRRIIPLK